MRRLFPLIALTVLGCRAAVTSAPSPTGRALAAAAPDPRAPLFVSVDWLAQHLRDPKLVVLHVGLPAEYPGAHIEGARLVSVADVAVADSARGLSVEMPSADVLRTRLAALGISDDSRVIIYYAKDMVYPSTRILFTLTYAGLGDRASLLDGGMAAWTAAGHPTSAQLPVARAGTLSPLTLRQFVVDAPTVQQMIGRKGVAIVDARDTAFYGGSRTGGSAQAPHRAGHIPSARNVPWSTLVDGSLRIQSPAAIAKAFDAVGVKPNDVIVGYCHTGQQATAMLLAARSLGHAVLLYDGSYQDWSARTTLPVEVGAPARKP